MKMYNTSNIYQIFFQLSWWLSGIVPDPDPKLFGLKDPDPDPSLFHTKLKNVLKMY